MKHCFSCRIPDTSPLAELPCPSRYDPGRAVLLSTQLPDDPDGVERWLRLIGVAADRGEVSQREVGELFALYRERMSGVESEALEKVRKELSEKETEANDAATKIEKAVVLLKEGDRTVEDRNYRGKIVARKEPDPFTGPLIELRQLLESVPHIADAEIAAKIDAIADAFTTLTDRITNFRNEVLEILED